MILRKENKILEVGCTGWGHAPSDTIGCEYAVINNQTNNINFFVKGQEEVLNKKINEYGGASNV